MGHTHTDPHGSASNKVGGYGTAYAVQIMAKEFYKKKHQELQPYAFAELEAECITVPDLDPVPNLDPDPT